MKDRDFNILELVKKGKSLSDIAKEIGLTRERIRQICKDNNIDIGRDKIKKVHKEILSAHSNNNLDSVIEKYGKKYVVSVIRRNGLSYQEKNVKKKERNIEFINLVNEGKSVSEIAEIYNVAIDVVYGVLRSSGIKLGLSRKETIERNTRIRKLYSTGNYSQNNLADMYNVTPSMISYIVLEKKMEYDKEKYKERYIAKRNRKK
jgi:DNA-binding CsgD family transcriptional regulator